MTKGGSIYMLSNKHNTTLYISVTSDLTVRIMEHKNKFHPKSFTARYNIDKLVYFENFEGIEEAIAREKQLKAGSRANKEALINSLNPEWIDLFESIC